MQWKMDENNYHIPIENLTLVQGQSKEDKHSLPTKEMQKFISSKSDLLWLVTVVIAHKHAWQDGTWCQLPLLGKDK